MSNYSFTLDYDAIITLDITSIPILKKLDPSYFEDFDISEYKKKKKFMNNFSSKVKFKKIQTLFSNEKLFESMTKEQIKFSELEKIIYTKNNQIAIFETYHSDFSSSSWNKYKVILYKNRIFFELISALTAEFDFPIDKESEMKLDSNLNENPKK